jgi:hypothetical protein
MNGERLRDLLAQQGNKVAAERKAADEAKEKQDQLDNRGKELEARYEKSNQRFADLVVASQAEDLQAKIAPGEGPFGLNKSFPIILDSVDDPNLGRGAVAAVIRGYVRVDREESTGEFEASPDLGGFRVEYYFVKEGQDLPKDYNRTEVDRASENFMVTGLNGTNTDGWTEDRLLATQIQLDELQPRAEETLAFLETALQRNQMLATMSGAQS